MAKKATKREPPLKVDGVRVAVRGQGSYVVRATETNTNLLHIEFDGGWRPHDPLWQWKVLRAIAESMIGGT